MTDKKEQARKLREAAKICEALGLVGYHGLAEVADRLDPPGRISEAKLRDWIDRRFERLCDLYGSVDTSLSALRRAIDSGELSGD